MSRPPPRSTRTHTLFPYPPLFRSQPNRSFPFPGQNRRSRILPHDANRRTGDTRKQPHAAAVINDLPPAHIADRPDSADRSEEHTSEPQPPMRSSYAVSRWKKNTKMHNVHRNLCNTRTHDTIG